MTTDKKPICRCCWHPAHRGDCGVDDCGCVRYVPVDVEARAARRRTWVCEVRFFVKNRWIASEVRVQAQGHGGAAMKALREAKRTVLKPRTRVEQVTLTLIPVRRGDSGAR